MKKYATTLLYSLFLALWSLSFQMFLALQFSVPWQWTCLSFFPAMAVVGTIAHFQKRLYRPLCLLGIVGYIIILWFSMGSGYGLSAIAQSVMLIAALVLCARDWDDTVTQTFLLIGMVIYALVFLLCAVSGIANIQVALLVFGGIYILVCIFLLGYLNVGDVSRRRDSNNKLLPGNMLLVGIFTAITAAIAFIRPIFDGLAWMLSRVGEGMVWLVTNLLYVGNGSTFMPTGDEAGDMLGMLDDLAPARSLGALTYVAIYLGIGLGVIAAIFFTLLWAQLALLLVQKLSSLLRSWGTRHGGSGVQSIYTEESQSLMVDSLGVRAYKNMRRALRRLLRPPVVFSALAPREQVRFAYKGILRRTNGGERKTPSEVLSATPALQLLPLYQRARYSLGEITPQEGNLAGRILHKR